MPNFLAAIRLYLSVAANTALNFHRRLRPSAAWTLRITGSTVVAYLVSTAVHPESSGITGALTALLVVQLTLHSIVRHGFDRVLAVVLGIAIASLLASATGLTWWTLAIAVAAAVLVGQLLRVGPNLTEVPISAMLVLNAGASSTMAAGDRLIETLIGATAGVLINLVFPPSDRTESAGDAIARYARDMADFLARTAPEIAGGVTARSASDWLAHARQLDARFTKIEELLTHADENRRLNVRTLAKRDPGVALREGLVALEHSAVVLRTVFRGISDVANFPEGPGVTYPVAARTVMAATLVDISDTLRCFAQVLRAHVDGSGEAEEQQLRAALVQLAATQERARAYARANPDEPVLVHELNVLLAGSTGRILRELSVEGKGWLSRKPYYEGVARHRAVVVVDNFRTKTRQIARR